MTTKWKWIFFLWHDWRWAVWRARQVFHRPDTPPWVFTEILMDHHRDRATRLRRELFPPKPMTPDEMRRTLERMKSGRRDVRPVE